MREMKIIFYRIFTEIILENIFEVTVYWLTACLYKLSTYCNISSRINLWQPYAT